jgi:hypothetical protein
MLLTDPMTQRGLALVMDFLARHALRLDAVKADADLSWLIPNDLHALSAGASPKEARKRRRELSDATLTKIIGRLAAEIAEFGEAAPAEGNRAVRLLIALLLYRGLLTRPRQQPQTPIYLRSKAEAQALLAKREAKARQIVTGEDNIAAAAAVARLHRHVDTTLLNIKRGSHGGIGRIKSGRARPGTRRRDPKPKPRRGD